MNSIIPNRAEKPLVPPTLATTAPSTDVSHGQETTTPPQNPSTGHQSRKLTFLAVATEWDSRHGGLSTFNRELCIALARNGHSVYCYVPDFADGEKASAEGANVNLIKARRTPGAGENSWLYRMPCLPGDTRPDIIVGHDRQTGSQAIVLAQDYFQGCRRVHFIHTDPSEIEYYKELPSGLNATDRSNDRRVAQVEMCKGADVVAAVGPRLSQGIGTELHVHQGEHKLMSFVPGLNQSGSKPRVPHFVRQCLVLGRAEDKILKGLDLAARAMGRVQETIDEHEIFANKFAVELVVRGVPGGQAHALWEWLHEMADNPLLRISVKNYTEDRDALRDDILKASLVLMPSRAEGFGLVALEAIDLAVPVLISRKSGLADYINSFSVDERRKRAVSVRSRSSSDKHFGKDVEDWASAIFALLAGQDKAFDDAWSLREQLKNHMDWDESAGKLCELLNSQLKSSPGSAS